MPRRQAAGIKTVSVDAYVTDPNTYNLYNNQVKYAELGAKWLFDQLGGTGTVYYMRGLAGNPADSDRDKGFKQALADNPNIKVVPNADGVATGWDPAKTTQIINDFIASGGYDKINGIWTSGMDSRSSTPSRPPNKKFVPIVGADLGAFVKQLLDPVGYPGLKGVAVTNTAAVGGAGISLALKLLNGETQSQDRPRLAQTQAEHRAAGPGRGRQPDADGQGQAQGDGSSTGTRPGLAARPSQVDRLDQLHPIDQAIACKGPGE